jgi:MoaA/NifB/PqqE/SkfB family radical SAM enzyme
MGMAVQNDGDICVCNLNNESFKIDKQVRTIDSMTVDQIWKSSTKTEIAKSLDNGIKHFSCKNCWAAEEAGKKSVRQELNQLFQHLEPDDEQPRILILKPGNTCNAACRMCFPTTSTSWYKDAFDLEKSKIPDLKFNDYIKKFEVVKNSFNPESPNMWPVLDRWYEKLRFIDIYGGEPFLIPGLWQSLQQAIDAGYASNIDLRISTNGSVYNEHQLKILTKFKSADIGISIDSHIKQEFEYIRHRLNYENIISNCKKILSFAAQHSNMDTRINCTITPINVWNIDEIYKNLNQELNTIISVTNFVYSPDHYDIRHLPKAIKLMLIEKLKNHPAFSPILNYMDQVIPGCVMHWPQFCMKTDNLDKIRAVAFKDVYPEWYAILEPYWDYKHPHDDWYGSCGFNS